MTTTRKTPTEAKPKAVAVLTTRAQRIGHCSYASGIIIEGVPAGAVNPVWQEADAGKVREARKAGAAVLQYKA